MKELDLGKTLKIEAAGDIKIEKYIKIEAGAVYNDGGNVTVNVYGKGDEKKEAEVKRENPLSEEVKLTVEDEEMLLPIFKGSRENLQQFFAEVKGLGPTRITAQVNRWIVDGSDLKKLLGSDR